MIIPQRLLILLALMCLPSMLAYGGGQRSRTEVFTMVELSELDATIASAVASGIPESTLQSRVDEGIAKRANATEILRALDDKIHHMEESRKLLDSIPGGRVIRFDQASWEWTAIMVEAGIPAEEIKRIAEVSLTTNRASDYRNATTSYLELTRAGVSPDQARNIAVALLHSPLPTAQFLAIDQLILRGGSDSTTKQEIAQLILEQLGQVSSLDELEDFIRANTSHRTEPTGRQANTSQGSTSRRNSNTLDDDDDRDEPDEPDDDEQDEPDEPDDDEQDEPDEPDDDEQDEPDDED